MEVGVVLGLGRSCPYPLLGWGVGGLMTWRSIGAPHTILLGPPSNPVRGYC